jgi:hypothetical protein
MPCTVFLKSLFVDFVLFVPLFGLVFGVYTDWVVLGMWFGNFFCVCVRVAELLCSLF